ncbi:hypothetical protein IDJ77_15510 [Mucilaginibacter sp. ZT4R22]|uniref:Uncharacterized protein n=1 Tax=Mucilaginibacter pankratovii TaxID=2772110 RepID=A0ABR7WVE5_9SPHI|nr:hypothetical protein [Mucilaginibacter pankratovii]MBD1365222.1 hypothetical protein [Mucilaginibacter pankratovii]
MDNTGSFTPELYKGALSEIASPAPRNLNPIAAQSPDEGGLAADSGAGGAYMLLPLLFKNTP